MHLHWVSSDGLEALRPEQLAAVRQRADGFLWVDIPSLDEAGSQFLREAFDFHPIAVRACAERSLVPKSHTYADHVFIVLNTPEPGAAGHVHMLELDQFIGRRYLITVHGPFGAGVALDGVLQRREVQTLLHRIEAGRFRPGCPAELSYTLVSALTRHMESLVAALAAKIAALERQVLTRQFGDPEQTLEMMFSLRHELLTIETLSSQSRVVYARVHRLAARFMPAEECAYFEDTANQFEAIQNICVGERHYLQGVIEFFENRMVTKLNIAMERLALITVLLLPVTAIASVYGMNIIVSERTDVRHVIAVITAIGVLTGLIAVWAKRRGWW